MIYKWAQPPDNDGSGIRKIRSTALRLSSQSTGDHRLVHGSASAPRIPSILNPKTRRHLRSLIPGDQPNRPGVRRLLLQVVAATARILRYERRAKASPRPLGNYKSSTEGFCGPAVERNLEV